MPRLRARESALIARAQEGDRDAFDELLRAHEAGARALAFSLGLDWDDASDAVQEASVRAYRAIGRFRLGEPFRPWYAQIVANEARGLHRRAGRRARLVGRLGAIPSRTQEGPEHEVLRSEQAAGVIEALGLLLEPHRSTIAYRYLMEFSEAETAAALRIPVGTVKSRVSRGLLRLRQSLRASIDESLPSEAA